LGSLLFGHTKEGRRTHRGDRVADQIEYENEDPGVRKLFERELAIRGVLSRQPG
jgi:hypothetical protein